MFDYERYDHTYCRPTRDADEPNEGKRRLSSASFEGMSDIDLNDHLASNQVTMAEKDCLPPSREPVIIVRTKKPRKTAPSPIIVKAVDRDGGALMVSAVNTPNNSSLVSKKIVSPVMEKPGASAEEAVEQLQEETPVNGKPTEAKSSSDDEPPEPVIQTTKSGRPRKLTAKAKQISEESKASKNRKSSKAKPAPDKNSPMPKRSRGRPKKNAAVPPKSDEKSEVEVSNGKQDTTASSAVDSGAEKIQTEEVQEKESKEEGNKDEKVESQEKKDGVENTVEENDLEPAKKRTVKRSAAQPVGKPAKKSKSSKAKPKVEQASAKGPVKINNAKSAPKRGRKPAPKLVIVTKPPPKRQATLRAEEKMKAARPARSQNAAPVKVDSSDNTKQNKRRRR